MKFCCARFHFRNLTPVLNQLDTKLQSVCTHSTNEIIKEFVKSKNKSTTIVSYVELTLTKVSVSVTVSAESICQFGFRFWYRTETKIVVSVVQYLVGNSMSSFTSSPPEAGLNCLSWSFI